MNRECGSSEKPGAISETTTSGDSHPRALSIPRRRGFPDLQFGCREYRIVLSTFDQTHYPLPESRRRHVAIANQGERFHFAGTCFSNPERALRSALGWYA
jgi:hypothetical protein